MLPKIIDDIPFYFFDSFLRFNHLVHFVSTRSGGESKGTFDSLNLSLRVNDDHECVISNRGRIAKTFGLDSEKLIISDQTHGIKVQIIDDEYMKMNDIYKSEYLLGVDGMVTSLSGICLCILIADCAPVVIFDPLKRVVGVAHAGWKGTAGKICAELIHQMQGRFGCNPKDLYAGIGPCISLESFEVGEEVASVFKNNFPGSEDVVIYRSDWEKPHVDIVRANQLILMECGIPESQIEISGICTFQEPEIFFSARRKAGGRFGCGMMLT